MTASSASSRRDSAFDWLFLLGVAGKAVDGLLELVAGVGALLISHAQLMDLAHALTADELSEEPHDFLANLLLHESAKLGPHLLLAGGIYLLVHGLVKAAIVSALVLGSRRIYPWAIGALAVLLVVQVIDLAVRFSWGVLFLTVLDIAVIAITIREWRHHRTLHDVLRARFPRLRAVAHASAEAT